MDSHHNARTTQTERPSLTYHKCERVHKNLLFILALREGTGGCHGAKRGCQSRMLRGWDERPTSQEGRWHCLGDASLRVHYTVCTPRWSTHRPPLCRLFRHGAESTARRCTEHDFTFFFRCVKRKKPKG